MAKKKERGSFTKLLIIIAVVMLAIVVKISYDRIIVARSFPLHKAIVAGNTEKIDKFSQEPEHINEETAKAGDLEKYPPRTSPLDIAIDQGNLDLVKLLLERGAEAATDNLDNAIKVGQLEIFRYLIEEVGLSVDALESKPSQSPLHTAAKLGEIEIVHYLIEKGANINAVNFYGIPLHRATGTDNFEMVKYLVEQGSDINYVDSYKGETPVFYSIKKLNMEITKYLFENGTVVDTIDKYDKTVLDYAIEDEDAEMISYLQSIGAKTAADLLVQEE